MTAASLLAWSLAELVARLRSGEVSSREATEAVLAALDGPGRALGAVARLYPKTALAAADAADLARARGDGLGPLHGVPLAHKDMFYRAGELAECDPWDTSRITGGSTSGGAAAVAAGLLPATLGSDTSGSIRYPAACCGLVGLKPTYGRVSRFGCMPMSFSTDHVGPLARSAEDVALVLALPTCPATTPGIAETDTGGDPRFMVLANRLGTLVGPFNYLGLPALSLPMGLDPRGMPLGLQLVGRPFAEALLLCVAHAYEEVAGRLAAPPVARA